MLTPAIIRTMSDDTVRENLRVYARVIANMRIDDPADLDALIKYAMEYQSRMGW